MSLLVVSDDGTAYSVQRGSIGKIKGWVFVSLNGLLASAVYKTKVEAEDALEAYIKEGKLETYGSAEV